jgi:predicted GH43/DUF377 family glycosyl hydrolase
MINIAYIPGLQPSDLGDIAAVMGTTDLTLRALIEAGKLDPKKDFQWGSFCGMPLHGQDVRGFDFTGADLRGTGIENAVLDETTILTNAILDAVPTLAGSRSVESDSSKLPQPVEAPSSKAALLMRQALYLRADPSRVLVHPFKLATEPREPNPTDKTRANHIVKRVMELNPEMTASELADVLSNFLGRHRNLLEICEARAEEIQNAFAPHATLTEIQRQLIGAYFLREYSFEASALSSPSIVSHPDQAGAPEGGRRFILSLRAVGGKHISSLTFRSGYIAADGSLSVDPTARLATIPRVKSRITEADGDDIEVIFQPEKDISERVIFPVTASQSSGIEDARFVEFVDGGRKTFYATYIARSATATRSELLETADFISFRMSPLRGPAARSTGMALFPRKIDGKYAMIGKQDNENLCLIYSADLHYWDGGVAFLKPQFPWEFVQIGNCGSPIELDEGWLLLTYGVGPVGQHSIGAALLDKNDPSKVLSRSRQPLIRSELSERAGYVPNVVSTCGAMRHNDQIVLPYAAADTFSNFATIKIAALMRSFEH